MPNPLKNWRTTSLGLTSIAGSIIHLIFAIHAGTATEAVWNASVLGILVGIGFILTGDASASTQAHEETKNMVADLQNQIASVKQDTATIPKPVDNVAKPTIV